MKQIEIDVDDITVDFSLYPRRGGINNEIVEQYRNSIDKLPAIVIQEADKILIDGFHRLQAHILEGKKTIKAEILDIPKERILIESIKRNNAHGYQLTKEDKQRLARELWSQLNGSSTDRKNELADLFSVSTRTIENWTRDLREKEKEEQEQRIFELWLSCWSQEEIAEEIGVDKKTVISIVEKAKNFANSTITSPPSLRIYDVWQFTTCDNRYGSNYPGRIPGQIIENLLWYYTEPFDIVLDPMVGSGTTIDVAKAMYRRVAGFDVRPVREDIIKRDTVKDGFPEKFRHKDYRPKLVFVDPPYFTMKKDEYSDEAISNNTLDGFYQSIRRLSEHVRSVLRDDGYYAFLIQNQTEKDLIDGKPIIHVFNCYEIIKEVGFNLVRQINCPQSTQTFNPQQVNRAKNEKRMLGIVRDLLVFEVKK